MPIYNFKTKIYDEDIIPLYTIVDTKYIDELIKYELQRMEYQLLQLKNQLIYLRSDTAKLETQMSELIAELRYRPTISIGL